MKFAFALALGLLASSFSLSASAAPATYVSREPTSCDDPSRYTGDSDLLMYDIHTGQFTCYKIVLRKWHPNSKRGNSRTGSYQPYKCVVSGGWTSC